MCCAQYCVVLHSALLQVLIFLQIMQIDIQVYTLMKCEKVYEKSLYQL